MLRKATETCNRILGVQSKIQTQYISITSLLRYSYTNVFDHLSKKYQHSSIRLSANLLFNSEFKVHDVLTF
jgi:hypothetical protein